MKKFALETVELTEKGKDIVKKTVKKYKNVN